MHKNEEILSPDCFAIILYDGVCNVCNHVVKFVLKRDSKHQFRFAALQSKAGQDLLKKNGLERYSKQLDTFVFLEGNQAYTHSTAAFRLLRRLGGPYSLLYVGIIIPRPIRDLAYRCFAKYRYRWFGKQDSCIIPSEKQRFQFLDM